MGSGTSASFVADRSGNVNSAVYLNSGYYSAPPGVYFRGDHTVAVWAKVISISTWDKIIDFGCGTDADNVFLSISDGGSRNPVSTVYRSSTMIQLALSRSTIQLSIWTHLAHTYSSNTCKLYLDGTLTATASCSAPRAVIRSNCYVGKSNKDGDGLLNAHIDELRIYNRTLNITEINQLMGFLPTGSTITTSLSTSSNALSTSFTTMASTAYTLSNTGSTAATNTINFAQLNSSQIIGILNSNFDLRGCIVNCSNNGQCQFNSLINNFFCSCNSIYLSGYACQIDTRPCSSNPCLNNATCVDFSNSGYYNMSSLIGANSSSFYCACDHYYKGTFCESKIDVCQNETCSSNGNCFDLNNKAKCECYSMYSGDRCESESNELKAIKAIISLASILAIIIIVLFYSCIVFMDITKYCCKRVNQRRYQHKAIIKKYTYINNPKNEN